MIKTKLKNYRNRFNLNQMILNKKNNNKRKQENKLKEEATQIQNEVMADLKKEGDQ